jgi:ATP-dependent Clp protease ATP-binding subunit ClpC
MEYGTAHRQFQQARFYSDEERRERENLRVLQEKTPEVR